MADDTTIGYAVLQIIPSLKGVSEAIEEQIAGQSVPITVEAKVDPAKVDKSVRDAVKKSKPPQIEVEAKINPDQITKQAQEAGRGVGGVLRDILNEALADSAKEMGVTVDQLQRQIGEKVGGAVGGAINDVIDATGIGDIARRAAEQVRGISDNFILARDAVEAFKGKDAASGLRGAEQLAKNLGIDISGTTGPLGEMATKADQTKGKISEVGQLFDGMPGPIGKAGKAIENLAGPLSVALTGADDLLRRLDKVPEIHDRFYNPDGSLRNPVDQYLNRQFPGLYNALPGPGAPPDPTGTQPNWGGIRGTPGQAPAPGSGQGPSIPAPGRVARPGDVGPDGRLLLPGQIVPGRATGGMADVINGMISGPGTGTSDSILGWPAGVRVSNGEFITNADDTAANLPLLQAINAGKPVSDWLKQLTGFEGGGLVAGSQQLREIIQQRFGISNIGGYRPADGFNEHSTGRALDVMVGNDRAKGDAVKDFALANASAIDLKWAIWQQQMWYPGGRSEKMGDRGNPTQNHMDHVHIFSGPGITNGLLGALQGSTVPHQGKGDGASTPSALGNAGATGAAAAPAGATPAAAGTGGSGGGFDLSSFGPDGGFGLNNLGAGVGTTQSGSDLSLFGQAAGAAVTGQVSSALGSFGIPGAPHWLQAASQFVSGISIGGSGGGGGASPLSAASAIPTSLAGAGIGGAAGIPDGVHSVGAGTRIGTQAVYNIQTARTEDAFIAANRKEKELALRPLDTRFA